MIASGINLVMTVIGFAVSTMFIVFVCTRLICARIQLNASRRSFPTAARSDLGILERGLHGLDPAVVASFPKKKFSDLVFSSSEDAQCAVCLSEYQAKDVLRILPYCGHSFHFSCIDIWLQQHSTCPVCRMSLREYPGRKRIFHPMVSSAIRSPYNMDIHDSHSYYYFNTRHGYSTRPINNQRMEPIQEDRLISELAAVEAGENIPTLTEGNHQITRDTTPRVSENKQVESPSNL